MTAIKAPAAKQLAAYRIDETYDWNYAHPPALPSDMFVPDCPGAWDFCGLPIGSPLGMPAGPLLNSGWVLYYAALGFDVLTYKTVRSSARPSHALPNLLPVRSTPLTHGAAIVVADRERPDPDSWAISFGMPSKDPAVWQQDVEAARKGLPPGKVLVVSVVASPVDTWTLDRIAAKHYADSTRWRLIAEANNVIDPLAIEPGTLLIVPEIPVRRRG